MAASGTVVIDVELSPAAARREALAHAVRLAPQLEAFVAEKIVAAAKVLEKYLTGDQS